MRAINVTPEKWRDIKIIYDDGEYSVIWGKYEGKDALGARWNGEDNAAVGYPNQGGNPTWYVEPDFISIAILQKLFSMYVAAKKSELNLEDKNRILEFWNLDNLKIAMGELTDKMSK